MWDRLFGTFIGEDRQIRSYGLARPLESYNPVQANIEHFRRMVYQSGTGKGWGMLLLRRWSHPAAVVNFSKLFSFDWRIAPGTSLWDIEDRVAIEQVLPEVFTWKYFLRSSTDLLEPSVCANVASMSFGIYF